MRIDIKNIKATLNQYFNLMPDKENEQEVIESVSGSIMFRGANLWILIFAILIASLGLNVNSTAVIIGAMLISPLMGPIIGMGLSVGINDSELLKRSLKNYLVATLISVATATVYFLISPLSEARSELLARTSPSLYDVLIAFCGGAAGVLALTTRSKGQVIPGVAIATALMPPLCTAGYGLATAQWSYFLGAFYLFFINTVFIALSTFLGVKLLRFKTNRAPSDERAKQGRRVMAIVVAVTMLPAVLLTVGIVRQNVFDRNVEQFVNKELAQPGTQILSNQAQHDTLVVVAVGRTIDEAEVAEARSRMTYYGMGDYELVVIQGTDSQGLESLTAQINSMVSGVDAANRGLLQQVADLELQLEAYARYDTLAARVNDEAGPLFPEVESIAIGRLAGEGLHDGHAVAIVQMKPQARRKEADMERLRAWLRVRLEDERMEIFVK